MDKGSNKPTDDIFVPFKRYQMFDIVQVREHEKLVGFEVKPITVTREGILPGCSLPSIDFRRHDGARCLGSKDNFFASPEAAWKRIRKDLSEGIRGIKGVMQANRRDLSNLQKILKTIKAAGLGAGRDPAAASKKGTNHG